MAQVLARNKLRLSTQAAGIPVCLKIGAMISALSAASDGRSIRAPPALGNLNPTEMLIMIGAPGLLSPEVDDFDMEEPNFYHCQV